MKPVSAIIIVLLMHLQSLSQSKNNNMSVSEQNKQIVLKVYEQALNKRNMDMLNQLVSDEFTGFGGKKGPEAFKASVQTVIYAVPDAQWNIREIIAEGEKVMVRWILQGTSQGAFNGFAPSGNDIANDGLGIFTVKNGKITASEVFTDRLAFLQQLNVLPTDITTLSKKGEVMYIDKFLVPAAAKKEFYERMQISRAMIRKLPGFIKDAAYEYTNDEGNLVCITVAEWHSREALEKARETVQAEYAKQGFDAGAMLKRLKISVDRGIYTVVED
jgi:Predicted ester cyclase